MVPNRLRLTDDAVLIRPDAFQSLPEQEQRAEDDGHGEPAAIAPRRPRA